MDTRTWLLILEHSKSLNLGGGSGILTTSQIYHLDHSSSSSKILTMKKGGRRTPCTGAEAIVPQEDWGVPNYSCTTTGCSQLILLHYSCNTTSGVLNFGPTSTTFSYNSTILAILLWGVPNFEPTNTSESCIVKETQHFCCKVEEVGP